MGVGGQRHVPAALSPGKTWYHCTGRCVGPRTGVENLASTKNRYPDRPAHSQSLYQLSYPGLLIKTDQQNSI